MERSESFIDQKQLKVLCYGNCNVASIYRLLENHPQITELNRYINFNFPDIDPSFIFHHGPQQIEKLKTCDVLIIQPTTEEIGNLCSDFVIKNYVRPGTHIIFVPWYQSLWHGATGDLLDSFEQTLDSFERKDLLCRTMKDTFPEHKVSGVSMTEFYRNNYKLKLMHHDRQHPTYTFCKELCDQVTELIGIEKSMISSSEAYNHPTGYFPDIYRYNIHKEIPNQVKQILELEY
jgi:hypothetical protein